MKWLFFWKKNNPAIDAFAKALADDLYSYMSPEVALTYFSGAALPGEMDHRKKKVQQASQKRQLLERQVKGLVLKVQQFRSTQKLGVYGKARLHMVFMERLRELGFEEQVVQKLNRMIILQVP